MSRDQTLNQILVGSVLPVHPLDFRYVAFVRNHIAPRSRLKSKIEAKFRTFSFSL